MTPLVLITGFLGAGKTTFLQRLLPEISARGLIPFVVLNDYANADIDAATLASVSSAVKALHGGCVCCGGMEELTTTLGNLPPQPGRIVLIETNGTTDVPVLLEMLLMDPALGAFTPPLHVAIVDAQRFGKRHHLNPLEFQQTCTAGFLSLSRTADVSEERVRDVLDSLRTQGVSAEVTTPSKLALTLHDLSRDWESVPARIPPHAREKATDAPEFPHDFHHFAALELPLPALVTRSALEGLITRQPASVFRIKGVARLVESPSVLTHFQRAAPDSPADFRSLEGLPFVFPPTILFLGQNLPALALRTAVAGLSPF